MGRGKRDQRKFRRDFKNHRPDVWRGDSGMRADGYKKSQQSNEFFEEYYQQQEIVPEGEWDDFMAYLRKDLPITFRINGSGQFANELRDKFNSDFFTHFHDGTLEVDGEAVSPPKQLPWYPNGYAYQLDFSRHQLRKSPVLNQIHEFMKQVTEAGSISRQEAVSMIPPLFLDVQPHHRVLDMCAAPGSKTFQILEALHAQDGNSSGAAPTGFVIANDAEAQRCNLLTHQTKRMCSPCLMVTNHEAQFFPEVMEPAGGTEEKALMQFDRILCDVPCSGDGTLRKAPDIWNRWSVTSGNGLHLLQLRITLQACKLLKVGGRLVYSTCTFNPVEDEAVVAEVLLRCGGAMKLLDMSSQLPELKRCQGKKKWRVKDRYRWYDTWDEACDIAFKLDPSMFCNEEKAALPLERCMRVLPHQQNTGGFFIAVLEKVAPVENFVWPNTRHRYNTGTGEKAGQGGTEVLKDLLGSAKVAAEKALQAAADCLAAFEAGDTVKTSELAGVAQAAAARAKLMADTDLQDREGQRQKGNKKLKTEGEETVAGGEPDVADGTVADEAEEVAKEEQEGKLAGQEEDGGAEAGGLAEEEKVEDMGMKEEEEGADAMEVEGDGADAAPSTAGDGEATPAPGVAPSWIRGGGRRNRPVPGGRWREIDAIMPVEDPALLQMVGDFYGLGSEFKLQEQLITRTLEQAMPKRLYFVTQQIMALLIADEAESLKITALGIKLFERHNVKLGVPELCCYRIAQEGLPFLLPHITKQRVSASSDVLLQLLRERCVAIPQIRPEALDAATGAVTENGVSTSEAVADGAPDGAAAADPSSHPLRSQAAPNEAGQQKSRAELESLKPLEAPEFLEQLKHVMYGCAVCVLREEEARQLGFPTDAQASGALTANAPLAICMWRSTSSINVLVSKVESAQLIDKLESARKKFREAAAAAPA